MKENIKMLHSQRTIWKSHGIIFIFFVNDRKNVDVKYFQTMRCIFFLIVIQFWFVTLKLKQRKV
jgi:hypothetical protein